MKQFLPLSGLLSGFLALAPVCASAQVTVAQVTVAQVTVAQVTVNPAALVQLAGVVAPPPVAVAAAPVAAPRPAVLHPVLHHWHPARHLSPAVVHAKPLPPVLPPLPVAARIVAPASPTPAAPRMLSALTFAFAPGSADLPANASIALKPYCTAPNQIAVDARAPTDPSDPSAAMRLSLSRAMAVQAALIACGVPPQNILPRADGDVPGKNEDETVIGSGGGAK